MARNSGPHSRARVKQRNFQVGDIVLIQEDKPIRGSWKLAEVIKIEPSTNPSHRSRCTRQPIKPGGVYQRLINGEFRTTIGNEISHNVTRSLNFSDLTSGGVLIRFKRSAL